MANKISWVVILFVLGWPVHGMAWGHSAHRIVGLIADQQLVPAVQYKIKEDFNITSLSTIANWADHIKRKKSQGPWHYANVLEGERAYLQKRDCPDKACVVEKVREFSIKISDSSLPINDKLEALKYLVHMIADLHQPLHLGNRKDRGGNNIQIIFQGRQTNLHALWDSGFLNINEDNLEKYVKLLTQRVSYSDQLLWAQSKIVDWANESRRYALDIAYNIKITSSGTLTKFYIKTARDIIELRLLQAGMRLAHLLNTKLN